jgi:hypothetical protein
LIVYKIRTSYNLQPSGGKLASIPFWKKTNLKKSAFVCIHDLNVPILNNDPKIEVMKAELTTQYCQETFKLDILSLRRKPVTCKWVFKQEEP